MFAHLGLAHAEVAVASVEDQVAEIVASRPVERSILEHLLAGVERRGSDEERWASLCAAAAADAAALGLIPEASATVGAALHTLAIGAPELAEAAARGVADVLRVQNIKPAGTTSVIISGSGARVPRVVSELRQRLAGYPRVRVLRELDPLAGADMLADVLRGAERRRLLLDALPYEVRAWAHGDPKVLLARDATIPAKSAVKLEAPPSTSRITIEIGGVAIEVSLTRAVAGPLAVIADVDTNATIAIEVRTPEATVARRGFPHGSWPMA